MYYSQSPDPADIVSVPSDCQFQKMRVSNYTVMSVARDIIEEEVYDDWLPEDYEEDVVDTYDDDGMFVSE